MMPSPFPRSQRGAGALAVSLLLLFGTSVVVFYLNRSLVFEQKTSANQMRYTSAFEMAEAGLEWATGMLNTAFDISTSCGLLSTSNLPFRIKYVQRGTNLDVAAATNAYPGCKVSGTTLTCSCPNVPAAGSEAVAALGASVQPGFTVAFDNVAGDPEAVLVTSTGCTAQAGACKPATALSASTTANSDATASVSAILKLRPLLRAAPQAALTCGTSCSVGGSYNIYNQDVASNGYLVNAGTTITTGNGTSFGTIPGQPIQNAMIGNDQSLNNLASNDTTCSNSNMFKAYFGSTMAEYAASPLTRTLPNCTNPSSCGSALNTAYNDGWRSFYFPDGLHLNNSAPFSVLGGTNDGVTIVSPGEIDINGNISIYGLIFSNSANMDDLGTGNANIYGAIVACNQHQSNGNSTLRYDPNALMTPRRRTGELVRVPGSWRDFQ